MPLVEIEQIIGQDGKHRGHATQKDARDSPIFFGSGDDSFSWQRGGERRIMDMDR